MAFLNPAWALVAIKMVSVWAWTCNFEAIRCFGHEIGVKWAKHATLDANPINGMQFQPIYKVLPSNWTNWTFGQLHWFWEMLYSSLAIEICFFWLNRPTQHWISSMWCWWVMTDEWWRREFNWVNFYHQYVCRLGSILSVSGYNVSILYADTYARTPTRNT